MLTSGYRRPSINRGPAAAEASISFDRDVNGQVRYRGKGFGGRSVMNWFAAPDYWFARLVFERGLAVIYTVAFIVAGRQFRGLLGARGLLPIPEYLRGVSFRRNPSLFHLRYSDRLFAVIAWS